MIKHTPYGPKRKTAAEHWMALRDGPSNRVNPQQLFEASC
jgi:hypothetical protein